MNKLLASLCVVAAIAACSSSSGSSGSTGTGTTTGTSTSSSGSTGSTGSTCSDAGIGQGQVQGFPYMDRSKSTQSFTYAFADGGADSSQLDVVMDADWVPPQCETAVGGGYRRMRIHVDTTTGGGVGPGAFSVDDGGARVRYEFSGDTSGGAEDALHGQVTLASVGGTGVAGSFSADLQDIVTTYPDDGGRQVFNVTGTFDAPNGGVVTEP